MRDDEKSTRKLGDAEIRDLPEKQVRPESEEGVVGGKSAKKAPARSIPKRGGGGGGSTGGPKGGSFRR